MNQPQGFRTFQILLALAFLIGFFGLLLFFFWKISELNTDIQRISVVNQAKKKVILTIRDARACELNFSGIVIGKDPISIRKLVNLRKQAMLRVDSPVNKSNVWVNSLRILPNHKDKFEGQKSSTFFFEMVFSDKNSGRKSPVKLLVSASGNYNKKGEFFTSTCHAAINDFED